MLASNVRHVLDSTCDFIALSPSVPDLLKTNFFFKIFHSPDTKCTFKMFFLSMRYVDSLIEKLSHMS